MEPTNHPKEPLPEVDWETFLEDFLEQLHDTLLQCILRPGVEGLIMCDTPEITTGYRKLAALMFGPVCTFKFEDLYVGRIFGETPSSWRTMRHLVRRSSVTLRYDSTNPPTSNGLPWAPSDVDFKKLTKQFETYGQPPTRPTPKHLRDGKRRKR